jgi:hypothetical protein
MWTGIAAANIGNPVFTVGETIQVSGTGTSGLKAWSDSSSVSPATYVVKAEGTVGTIVSGPVFAQGYNRWEIRYKGETVTRWSAEDYLAPAAKPAAPSYVSPSSGATFTTPPAKLDWNDVAVATSYDVYLDGSLKGNVTATEYALANLSLGSHTWQIKAKNSAGTVAGATWGFSYVLPAPATPASPTPGNNATLYTPPALLDWTESANATSYDIYLDGTLAGNVTASQWTFPTPPSLLTKHVWRVVARNLGGVAAGPDWSFKVAPIAGDANADGIVNTTDYRIVTAHYGQSGTWETGDFDGDGRVGFSDYQILEQNLGNTAPAPAASSVGTVSADEELAGVTPTPVTRPVFSLKPVKKPRPVRHVWA